MEEKQTAPALTLEPDLSAPAVPTLTLDPEPAPPAQEEKKPAVEPEPMDAGLSPEEKKAVDEFAEKIDLRNSTVVLQYGAASQKKVADFSSSTLENIRTKDLGVAVGDFSLMGDGRLRMDYLPADCQLLGGDLVVTSGLGGYYPSGLVIGSVEEVKLDDSGSTQYAVLSPSADFDALTEVFVIKDFTVVE